jgi:uncharacterized GH25 family protein
LLALLLISAGILPATAQYEVVHAKPIKVKHLSGVVVDPRGATVEYAEIQLLDHTNHHMLASTFADAKGAFSFPDKQRGTWLEVRVLKDGFNRVQYTVHIGFFGRDRMRLILPVAA